MSHYGYNPPHHASQIVVHDHDVLSGRGVNIAHHPGNQRFRTLVTTRADESYCTSYSASEKKAVAEEIVRHIKALIPPGKFLKRDGRGQVSRGLAGPWEELTPREIIKKTCQALRDCNRLDRQGYANGVSMPNDVAESARQRVGSGLTGKQQAAQAAAQSAAQQAALSMPTNVSATNLKRDWGRISPSVENAAEWLKRQKTDESSTPTLATPSTSGSDSMLHGGPSIPQVPHYDPVTYDPIPPHPHFVAAGESNPPPPHPQYASMSLPTYSSSAFITPAVSAETYAPSQIATHPYIAAAPPPAPAKDYHGSNAESSITFGSVPPGSETYPPSSSTPTTVVYQHTSGPATYQQNNQSTAVSATTDQNRAPPSAVYAPAPATYPFTTTPYASTNTQTSASQSNGAAAYSALYQQVQPRSYTSAPNANPYSFIHTGPPAAAPPLPQQAVTIPAPSPIFGGPADPVPAYTAPGTSSITYRPVAAPVPTYQHQIEPGHQQHRSSLQHPPTVSQAPLGSVQSSSYLPIGEPVMYPGAHVPSLSKISVVPLAAPAPPSYAGAPANTPTTMQVTNISPDSSAPAPGATTAPQIINYVTTTEYQPIAPAPSKTTTNNFLAPPEVETATTGMLTAPTYEHGDILAPSAGADLLITAASQSTAVSSESLVESVVAAPKWEGEALGL
eukprot:CAMPEP_0194147628 /NCGR_PEP_ID=MMETSP0152-20130528/26380_1 /TAXON_ID=1049557 /ORGANISM="Thalassiothrix antarctica, Strain L6-D1" /LENGTH=674 /DNA_ID=CAMNT_0038848571 /DNA_START=447 /DNA_END=2471 /DNA_ORIENTATION=+